MRRTYQEKCLAQKKYPRFPQEILERPEIKSDKKVLKAIDNVLSGRVTRRNRSG